MRLLLATAALVAMLSPARADVITTFTISGGETEHGGFVTGTFKIDQTTWNNSTNAGFVSGSILVTNDGSFDGIYNFLENDGSATVFADSTGLLILGTGGPPPIQNGTIPLDVTINDFNDNLDFAFYGTLTASTPISTPSPEPASWAIMSVALLGLGMTLRRQSGI